ncbi:MULTISPECIES: DUF3040 domain-containing protein [Rothia]|uniref:DUF3040 domain-containing protein n=1 Tax=Rothia kristinae TaxID=37923 RepID=A0A7T3CFG9_9MICC|nr:DUF3040 domain-containing protein [Rothia kristinae]TDP52916.1 hypothetical protein DEU33_1826 [Kocuria sp. AG109]SIM02067.1 Protein of uncharacterised function (DUF3040) [Mycobacteroides abscessus subsp. abscessus]KTR38212.1 hypothetical protein RSA5_05465 [Rothia kristinae]KTR73447.1 hypothetical protein SA15R_04970 [Rothia kristinae]KTR79592.1 hypothetical protein SA14R_03750 [Rothia kristinae]
MALSERERQLLEQLEQQLNVEDPTFADTMQEERPRPRPGAGLSGRNLVLGIVVAVLGLGLVLLGVSTQLILVGVLGFLVMAGGVYLATLRRREGGGRSEASGRTNRPRAGERGVSFMQRLEQQWEDRHRER